MPTLPDSLVPRAKMTVTSLQPVLLVTSFSVEEEDDEEEEVIAGVVVAVEAAAVEPERSEVSNREVKEDVLPVLPKLGQLNCGAARAGAQKARMAAWLENFMVGVRKE